MSVKDNQEIPQSIKDHAKKLESYVAYDAETQGLVVTKGAFEATLPEGLSHDDVKKSLNAIKDFTTASGLVTGEVGIKALKDNKSLDSVSAKFNIARGVDVEHTVTREFTARNVKTGEDIVRHGRLDTSLTVGWSRAKGNGEIRAVRNYLYEQGEKSLKK